MFLLDLKVRFEPEGPLTRQKPRWPPRHLRDHHLVNRKYFDTARLPSSWVLAYLTRSDEDLRRKWASLFTEAGWATGPSLPRTPLLVN